LETLLGTDAVTENNREQQPDRNRVTDLNIEEELENLDRA